MPVDWSPLAQAGGDAATAAALFRELEQAAVASSPSRYTAAHTKLTALLAAKPDVRHRAAAVAPPFLYGLAADPQRLPFHRSLPLQLVAVLALGEPQACVPHGLAAAVAEAEAKASACARQRQRQAPPPEDTAALVLDASAAEHLVPLLQDRQIAVRSWAAFLLAFFPGAGHAAHAAHAALAPLLAMVEREERAEPRLTAMLAVAMLQRGGSSSGEAKDAPDEDSLAKLESRCQHALRHGPGHTESDAATFGLAAARCIVGVHALADVQLLLRVACIPSIRVINAPPRLLRDIPRVPDHPGEPELPFADPDLARLAYRVLAHLPGRDPQPTAIVIALADALNHAAPDDRALAARAVLRSAWGTPDTTTSSTSTGTPWPPWPAYADLDDRQGAAFRALARQDGAVMASSLLPVLADWGLPLSHGGLKAYMAGKRPAREAAAADQRRRKGGRPGLGLAWRLRSCFMFLCGPGDGDNRARDAYMANSFQYDTYNNFNNY